MIEIDEDEIISTPGKSAKPYVQSRMGASVPSATFEDYDLSHMSRSPNHRSRTTVNKTLPTPAKTPSKRKLSSSDISSASRKLFPAHSSTRPKKSTPLSLESFEAPASKEIQIYTDSRDKIPKTVTDMETPFNAKPDQAASSGSRTVPKNGTRARKHDKKDNGAALRNKQSVHSDQNDFTE